MFLPASQGSPQPHKKERIIIMLALVRKKGDINSPYLIAAYIGKVIALA